MQESSETTDRAEICVALEKLGVLVHRAVSATKYTTLSVGGDFEYLLEIENKDILRECVSLLFAHGQSYRPLGFGSNLYVSDDGIRDWVIKLGREFRFVHPQERDRFTVGGSMPLMSLSRSLSQDGYSGLEFAGGIPASFGGAVKMNAGAHGGEMSNLLSEVSVMSETGEIFSLSPAELDFSYRRSNIQKNWFVVSADISLTPGDKDRVSRVLRENLEARRRTQPLQLPSAGSVFKNPSRENSAGQLIEQCGLKGKWCGGAQISDLHGNWIVNPGRSAKSVDVRELIDLCQRQVFERYGIYLETEVKYWSQESDAS